tara:strand:+ start:681 stop:1856 length:1176 start_codon:yes stop_codon:yes gene_type:complete
MSSFMSSVGSVLAGPIGQIGGQLLGGIIGRKTNQPQQQGTQVITNDPPSYAMPNLQKGADEASRLYDTPRSYFGDTYVPFSTATTDALDLGEARARAGSPLTEMAKGQLGNVIGGNFLQGGNPFFNAAVQEAMNPVEARVNSVFSRSGRLGSGANQEILSRDLTNAALGVRMDDYNRERQAQLNALTLAPTFDATDFADIAQLAAVGGQREAKDFEKLTSAIDAFNFAQNEPWANVNRLICGTMGTIPAGVGTQATPIYGNPAAQFYAGTQAFGQPIGQAFNFLGNTLSGLGSSTGSGGGSTTGLGTTFNPQSIGSSSSYFSDIRLKDNVRKIGKSPSGLNIYEWNYKWSPQKYSGVIAQELQKIMPNAVTNMFGYLAVNYDLIDVNMQEG